MTTVNLFSTPPPEDPYGRDRLRRIAQDIAAAYNANGYVPWSVLQEHILGTLDQIKMRAFTIAAIMQDPASEYHRSALSLIRQMDQHNIFYHVEDDRYVANNTGLTLCFANFVIYTFLE